MKWSAVLFLFYIQKTLASNGIAQKYLSAEKTCQNGKIHEVDNIIEGLTHEQWSKLEESCYKETLSFLHNVRNHTLWATWIWDSNPRPVGTFYGSKYHLGGYDQCLKPPWVDTHSDLKTQYCLADIVLSKEVRNIENDLDPFSPMEEYFRVFLKGAPLKRKINTISHGVCLPAICEPSSVAKVLRIMFQESHLGTLEADISIDYCQVSGEDTTYPTDFYIFIILFTLLLSTAVISTVSKLFVGDNISRNKYNKHSIIILKSFCLKRNIQDLFKVNNSDIAAITIIKTIVVLCATSIHLSYFGLTTATMNSLDFDKAIMKSNTSSIMHAHIGVDSFFAISGLLLVNSLMGKQRNPFTLILNRYIRLVVPFAFMILYTTSMSYYVGSGPLWGKLAKQEQEYCKKNWLWSLLMMNNYVHDKEICQITWWYIPTDFHAAVLGTLVIYFYKKYKLGNIFLAVISAIIIAIPGFVTYINNYNAILWYDLGSVLDLRNNYIFLGIYMKSHNRMGPYIVGMLAGYIISTYKPSNYKLSIKLAYTTFVASLFSLVALLALADVMSKRQYDPVEAAIFTATIRVAWGAVMCIIIILGEYAHTELLNILRRFSFFVVINRLSYCIYLVHTAFIQRRWYSSRNPYGVDAMSFIIETAGVVTFSILGSVVLYLLVEAPMVHITNHLLFSKTKTKVEGQKDSGTEKALSERGELEKRKSITKLLNNGS